MNNFIEYVCRGVIRSEDAIRNLHRNVAGLVKCNRSLTASVICLGVAGLLLTSVVVEQDKEIKVLKRQVADLAKDEEGVNSDDTATKMEDEDTQKGA